MESILFFDTFKKTIRHSFIYGLGTSFAAIIGLLLIPIYTRFLTPDDYGVYALVSMLFTLLIFVYDLGMINALFRWYYEYTKNETDSRRKVISTVFIFLLVLAFSLSLFLWKETPVISKFIFNRTDFSYLIRLMLIAVFLQSLTWVPLSLLRIRENVVTFVVIIVIGMIIMILANFLFLSSGKGVKGIYEAYIISSLFVVILLFLLTWREYSFTFSFKELREMLKFALPFLPVLFFCWILDFSDRYFLKRFCTLNDVGIYSVGYKIGQILYLANKTFAIAWIPIMLSLYQRYREKTPYIIGRLFTYFILSIFILFLMVSIFGKEIISIFTSSSYYNAVRIIPLIAFSYVLYGIYLFMLSGLIIAKSVFLQPIVLFLSAILNIILNITLIPRFNIIGAGIATVFSYLLVAVLTYYLSQKIYPIPIESKRLWKIFLSVFIIYYLATLINFSYLILSIILKGILLITFFVILYLIGFFQVDEINKLKLILVRAFKRSNKGKKR